MDALDSYFPEPVRELDKPFLMPVEDVFSITGRGTVATGRVERGLVKVGDEVEIVGLGETKKTTVTGVEMFRKSLDQGQAGDNVGALLRGVDKTEIQRGQVLAKPGSIHPHTKFTANVYVLTKEEGGRHTPFFPGYRPQFYIRTTDVTGSIKFEGEMVMPGDNVVMEVELINPVAIEEGMRFAIREGGRTVGAGIVDKIVEATSKSNEDINNVFDVDEGARYVGEFSFGVNPYITKPMLDILFDEKIMGSIHFTPGSCYDECDNGNKSALHWDLIQVQTEEYGGGEIYLDDVLVRKNGRFVLPELSGLNPENLV